MFRMFRMTKNIQCGYQKQAEIKLVTRMYRIMKIIKWMLEASRNKACEQNVQNDKAYQVDIKSKQKESL